jgi:hypothetical protein
MPTTRTTKLDGGTPWRLTPPIDRLVKRATTLAAAARGTDVNRAAPVGVIVLAADRVTARAARQPHESLRPSARFARTTLDDLHARLSPTPGTGHQRGLAEPLRPFRLQESRSYGHVITRMKAYASCGLDGARAAEATRANMQPNAALD